jgi:hypothetical protein
VDDRLSFRRFAGLPLDQGVPDHATIWRFRQELERLGLSEALFAEINGQLDARGVIVRKGTLIDATIVEAAVTPPAGKDTEVSARDPQAGWTKKNGKSRFGYKAHIAVDQGSGIIRGAILSSADLHDSQADRPWSKATRRPSMPTKPTTVRNFAMPWPKPGSPMASCTRPAETPHSRTGSAGSTRRSRRSAPASSAASPS